LLIILKELQLSNNLICQQKGLGLYDYNGFSCVATEAIHTCTAFAGGLVGKGSKAAAEF
jgi:hypothetical protein